MVTMPEQEAIEAPLESTPPPPQTAEEKLTAPGFDATPKGVEEAMKALKDSRMRIRDDYDDPVVERKLEGENAKKFAELTPEQQKRAAGKMLSDQHKVEAYRAVPGLPLEMKVSDANAIEELIDSGRDPSLQRDWSAPGHPAKERTRKVGLTVR
jgi:hypothetical protein